MSSHLSPVMSYAAPEVVNCYVIEGQESAVCFVCVKSQVTSVGVISINIMDLVLMQKWLIIPGQSHMQETPSA